MSLVPRAHPRARGTKDTHDGIFFYRARRNSRPPARFFDRRDCTLWDELLVRLNGFLLKPARQQPRRSAKVVSK